LEAFRNFEKAAHDKLAESYHDAFSAVTDRAIEPLLKATLLIVLPGFPTSAIFTFNAFVAPLIRARAGLPVEAAHTVTARVLDEPTASLDFGNQGKVMSEIRALAKSGHGVLFTTHDPNHALRAADRAYLLREGKRLDEGPVDTVLRRAQLEALYGASVQQISDENRRAFLPG
jgi:hypothetical protein